MELERNLNITMEIIDKYPNKPWDWYEISRNPNITMEFIEKNPNKPWDWEGISRNCNITIEIIEKNIDKIDFVGLSKNKFTYHNKLVKKYRRYMNLFYLQKLFCNRDIQRLIIIDFL